MITQSFGNIPLSGIVESASDALVPYSDKPIVLARITTLKQMRDYAATGYHITNKIASAGGCKDTDRAVLGRNPSATCASGINSANLRTKWGSSAKLYHDAFYSSSLPVGMALLSSADALATEASRAQSEEAPRRSEEAPRQSEEAPRRSKEAPPSFTSDSPNATSRFQRKHMLIAVVGVSLIAAGLYLYGDDSSDKDLKGAKRRSRRRRSRGRR